MTANTTMTAALILYTGADNGNGSMEGHNLTDVSYNLLTMLSPTASGKPKTNTMYVRPQMDSVDLMLSNVVSWLRLYYTPIVIALGIAGNSVSLTVLLYSAMKTLSAARYLTACILVDSLYLGNLFVTWLVELGYPLFSMGALCHATTFASKACAFLSVWYTVSYAIDVLIATRFPNAERQMCTVFKAKLVCLVLGILAIVVFLNISLLVTVINLPSRQVCIPLKRFEEIQRKLDQLDVFVNFFLPCLTSICICISCGVQCYKDGLCQRHGPHRPPQRSVHVECDVEAGKMSLYFAFTLTNLLLTLPLSSMNSVLVVSGMTFHPLQLTLKRHLIMEIFRSLYNLKFASNLPVFLLAWKGFRTTVVMVAYRVCGCLVVPCRSDNSNFPETIYVDYSMDGPSLVLHASKNIGNGFKPNS